MAGEIQATRYRPCAGVSWLVQGAGVLVIDEMARRSLMLAYPEAAVWELLLRGHDARHAGAMLRWIVGDSEQEAHSHVGRCVQEWSKAGLITATESGEEE